MKKRSIPFFRPLISVVTAFYMLGFLKILEHRVGIMIPDSIIVLICISSGIIVFSISRIQVISAINLY